MTTIKIPIITDAFGTKKAIIIDGKILQFTLEVIEYLLLENGDFLLLESGDKIILE